MKKLTSLSIGLVLLVAAPVTLACEYPEKPSIPAGGDASKEEMIAASRAVKAYQAEMTTYRECIDSENSAKIAELAEPDGEEGTNLRAALTKKYNASVEEEELIVARFNEAVREYKENTQ